MKTVKEIKRLCIYPADVHLITGKSMRQAQMLLRKIRRELHKLKHQAISIDEFCEYMGLDRQSVIEKLN